MKFVSLLIVCAFGIPTSTSAQSGPGTIGLPTAGACSFSTHEGRYNLFDRIEWRGDIATVTDGPNQDIGEVAGLRNHDGGFRLSVFYTDGIIGDSEIVLFTPSIDHESSYRMAHRTYETLPDGRTVTGSISPFKDAECVVLY